MKLATLTAECSFSPQADWLEMPGSSEFIPDGVSTIEVAGVESFDSLAA